MSNRSHESKRSPLVRLGVVLGVASFAVGGLGAASEPAPPAPDPTEQAIGSWSGRPFVPQQLGDLVEKFVPAEHRQDLTMSLKVYTSQTAGRYAVASYVLYDDAKFTTTLTCEAVKPTDADLPPNTATSGAVPVHHTLHVIANNGDRGFMGRIWKLQDIELGNAFTDGVCEPEGLTISHLDRFKRPSFAKRDA